MVIGMEWEILTSWNWESGQMWRPQNRYQLKDGSLDHILSKQVNGDIDNYSYSLEILVWTEAGLVKFVVTLKGIIKMNG